MLKKEHEEFPERGRFSTLMVFEFARQRGREQLG